MLFLLCGASWRRRTSSVYPVFYYGNPDTKTAVAMRYLNQISGGGSVPRRIIQQIYDRMPRISSRGPFALCLVWLDWLMLRLMTLCIISNGLSKAAYVRNIWEIFVKIGSLNVRSEINNPPRLLRTVESECYWLFCHLCERIIPGCGFC